MRNFRCSAGSAVLLVFLLCIAAPAEEPGPAAAAAAAKVVTPFVDVPAGTVRPGCTQAEYAARHGGNQRYKDALQYDVWGGLPPVKLPAFQIGRYEVTNAQWKHYLDRVHRREHVVGKNETLRSLASKYVKDVDGTGFETEWIAIYALNAFRIVEAWKNDARKDKDGKAIPATWRPGWRMDRPPSGQVAGGPDIGKLFLPEGLKIFVYTERTPDHWYGWCRLSRLQAGREYCDAGKPAPEAFQVPKDDPLFAEMRLRDDDFAAYPVRGIAPRDALQFCEWAGCDLPSEYEWERAGRGDKDWLYTWAPEWVPNKEKNLFPWADNKRAQFGTFRVDDPSCARSDSWVGARMLHGNVWELTRTFFDIHPGVKPEPPPPTPDTTNYGLIAKGGSFGDGWQNVALSMRTGYVGSAVLNLVALNRADSLGFRLVRHAQPGRDLLRHSIMRLSYEFGRGRFLHMPHAFAMQRMAGAEEAHIVNAGPPYAHAQKRAHAIAFAPLHFYEPSRTLSIKERVNPDIFDLLHREYKRKRGRSTAYLHLGVLRTAVALKGGVRMTSSEADALKKAREDFEKAMREWRRLPKKRRDKIKMPGPPPPEPDEFETITEDNAEDCGLWKGGTVPPGEYHVLYWNGFFALANKALTMPPLAIFTLDRTDREMRPKKLRRGKGDEVPAATLTLEPDQNRFVLEMHVEEQPDKKKPLRVPDESSSSEWALAETTTKYWRGPDKPNQMWRLRVVFPTADKELAKFAFTQKVREIGAPAEKTEDTGTEEKKDAAMSGKGE